MADTMVKLMPDLPATTRAHWASVFCEMRGREILDTYVMSRLSHTSHQSVVILGDGALEVLQSAREGGRGVILAMAHYGRPNMMAAGLGLAGERLGMLTMDIDAPGLALDTVERSYLKMKVRTLQHCIGGPWLTLGSSMRSLYKALNQGEAIFILFDIPMNKSTTQTVSIPFFNGLLTVPRSIERLARKTGAQIIYAAAKERGWHVITDLRPLPDDPADALTAAVKELERDIRMSPGLWWQWNVLDALWNPTD